MTRYAAFLRGVNLGKRTVKSAELKTAFEGLGLENVKTLLASGNVLFDAKASKSLKEKIEAGLKAEFSFEVPIVLRTVDELKAMVAAFRQSCINPTPPIAGVGRMALPPPVALLSL